MRGIFVSMHTIGRTTEENLRFLLTAKRCAQIGLPRNSFLLTKMAAKRSIDANTVMAGKNNSFILTILKLSLVTITNSVKNLIVLTITMKVT